MKIVLNLIVLALIGGLAYALVGGIQEPIKFKDEFTKRETAVTDKLQQIRSAQEIFREITGEFAGSFDTLSYVLTNDSIPFIRLEADPNDPTDESKYIRVVTYSSAIDSIRAMKIDLDDLSSVPFSNNARFEMKSDTTTYQSTLVPVMECMTRYKEFMGPYADVKYSKYDDTYDPNARIGFGSLSSPNLEGTWN